MYNSANVTIINDLYNYNESQRSKTRCPMLKEYKPTDYNSVSPYLVVQDGERMITLLEQVFGAKEIRRFERDDGSIMHAEIMLDDSVIMMGEASADYPPNQLLLHVYVPDVDQTFQRAIDNGCEVLQHPHMREGEIDKRGMFADFNGNTWSVSTQQSDM